MSAVIIEARINQPAVRDVLDRLPISSDQVVEMWYEAGCKYIDWLRSQIAKSEVYYELFGQVVKRDSFRHTEFKRVFSVIQESPVFWDFWARVLKCVCEVYAKEITSVDHLKMCLNSFTALPSGWVMDRIFTKNK